MPKKFAGENKKSAAAKARKTAVEEEKQAEKQKQLDDSFWQENDKQVLKKQQRRQKLEEKKQNILDKKAQNKVLLEEDMKSLKTVNKIAPAPKVTRAQIDAKRSEVQNKDEVTYEEIKQQDMIEENMNRTLGDTWEARNVTDAIALLDLNPPEKDKNPEKRRKAAYTAYEERRLEEIRQENTSSLRLSQLKQIIFKEWQKCPDNPLNKTM